jgi:hypothetical protein
VPKPGHISFCNKPFVSVTYRAPAGKHGPLRVSCLTPVTAKFLICVIAEFSHWAREPNQCFAGRTRNCNLPAHQETRSAGESRMRFPESMVGGAQPVGNTTKGVRPRRTGHVRKVIHLPQTIHGPRRQPRTRAISGKWGHHSTLPSSRRNR